MPKAPHSTLDLNGNHQDELLPETLERDVLVEAGHRCTIPTCRQFPVQIHDIEEQAADGPSSVIALCSNCHERVARGYITRRSLEQYKANLAIINARYGGLERRALYTFVEDPTRGVLLPTGMVTLMSFLLRDRMVEVHEIDPTQFPSFSEYRLTARGKKLLTRWAKAQPLD